MTKKTLFLFIPLMLTLLLSAVVFIPIGSNYSRIQVQSGRLGGLLRAHVQFRDLKTEPCFRKFTGVIITGVLPEDSDVDDLEKFVMENRRCDVRLLVSVKGRMVERSFQ